MIWIEPVDNKRRLKSFIDFPHKLYQGDSNYVPELFIAQKDLLTPGKHPFHEHSAMKLFLVYKNNTLKGRIAAILNNNHNEFNQAADGFFGFFDCVDDIEIAKYLFTEAAKWLREKGARTVIGPVNPSTNEPCGMLADGFEKPPVAMMVYNKPYYNRLVEECGFQKKVDLLAYDINIETIDDRSVKLQESLLKRLQKKNITIRPVNVKEFKKEVEKVREVYNAAWDHNLGFVPMTDKEFNYLAKDLKQVLDPQFCMVAEHEGKLVGFVLAIPDINQVLIKLKRGRLFPTGIFKLLMGLRKINYVRVLALGVTEGYRKMGIEACFYASMIMRGRQRKIKGAEASWILEGNEMMNKGISSMNGKVYKKYRIYRKDL
jgi:GNAT superfamily N-acetyltransferase